MFWMIRGLAILGVLSVSSLTVNACGSTSGDSSSNGIPDGKEEVAIVSGVSNESGVIDADEYSRALDQAAARSGLEKLPLKEDPEFEKLNKSAMNDLLDEAWLTGESAERGIEVTDEELTTEVQLVKQQQFNSAADFQTFLESSHMTEEEVYDRTRLQLLGKKVQEDVLASAAGAKSVALRNFTKEYEAKWTARTLCAEGFAIDRCSNAVSVDSQPESSGPVEPSLEEPSGTTDYGESSEPMGMPDEETLGGLSFEDLADPEKLKDCLENGDHLSDLTIDGFEDEVPSISGTAEAADGGTVTIFVSPREDGSNLAFPSWGDVGKSSRDVPPTVEAFKDIFACTGAYPDSETQEYYTPIPPDQEAAVQEEAEKYGG